MHPFHFHFFKITFRNIYIATSYSVRRGGGELVGVTKVSIEDGKEGGLFIHWNLNYQKDIHLSFETQVDTIRETCFSFS